MNLDETMNYIKNADDENLFILWTNADALTAKLMVFMYAENSVKQEKWKEVMIVIWGATVKLVAENAEIQEAIKRLQGIGIKFSSCVTCVKELGLEKEIGALGIDMVKWLNPLTEVIKSGRKLITV